MDSLLSTSEQNSSGIKLESGLVNKQFRDMKDQSNTEPLSEMECEKEFESKKVMFKSGSESKTDIVSQFQRDAGVECEHPNEFVSVTKENNVSKIENISESEKFSGNVDRLSSNTHAHVNVLQPSAVTKDQNAMKYQKQNKQTELDITTIDSPLPVNGNGTEMDYEMADISELNPALENETVEGNQQETMPKASNIEEPLPIRKKRFSCEYCGMFFSKISNHKKHLRIHTGEKPFKCDECDAAFTSKSNMNIHMRLHTGEKPYECDLCEAAFVQKSHLLKHRAAHTSDKPIKCEFCSTTVKDTAALLVHKETHYGETPPVQKRTYRPRKNARRPYKCEVCDATFLREARLIYHARIHTGEKPHKCATCSATFSKRGSLTIHMRVHTGEKPFTCQHCNAAFSQKGSLTIHQKVHRGDYGADIAAFPETPLTPKPTNSANEPESVKKVPEKKYTPNSRKTSKRKDSEKKEQVDDCKVSAKVMAGIRKKIGAFPDPPLTPTPTKPANEPESVKKVPEKKYSPDSPKTSKTEDSEKKKQVDNGKVSAKVMGGIGKKTKTNEKADNVFALDPVDPIFSEFITSMHQRANAGEIATDSLFQ